MTTGTAYVLQTFRDKVKSLTMPQDLECNRFQEGKRQGMFLKGKKAKKGDEVS